MAPCMQCTTPSPISDYNGQQALVDHKHVTRELDISMEIPIMNPRFRGYALDGQQRHSNIIILSDDAYV
jgi:hypothetical protein